MMRTVLVTLGLLTLGSLLVASASAHATIYSPDGKIRFVYGHLNEPAYTFTKTGLDLTISDNATRAGISGLETDGRAGETGGAAPTPKLTVKYRYGAEGGPTKDISNDFRAQHGAIGKYTHPITFTRPGLYSIVISGTINGTVLDNFVLAPAHEVEPLDDTMWPDQIETDDEQIARIEALEAKVEAMGGDGSVRGSAAGIEFLPLVVALGLVAIVARRR